LGCVRLGVGTGCYISYAPRDLAENLPNRHPQCFGRTAHVAVLGCAVRTVPSEQAKVISTMLGEGGLTAWPRPERPEVPAVSMEERSDLQFLSPEETRLTRLVCPECGGALAETVLPQISYYHCHVGHQFGPQEETAALARHLATHPNVGEGGASQQTQTAVWAASLAESLRTQIEEAREA
jgi:hypothetical protein